MPTKAVSTRSMRAARSTALVTGASSGIGEALAHRFAAENFDLVLVARSADKLGSVGEILTAKYGVAVRVESCDLSRSGAPAKLAERLKDTSIDVLVNNAGVLEQGKFIEISPQRHQAIIDLNITSLTAMLLHFVPPMEQRGQGRVLNVASVGAFQPTPSLASYAASKAYVLSLSEALAEELRGSGVTVTTLCPGITATNMLTQATGANDKLKQLPRFLVGDVNDVAAQGFAACMRGDAVCVPGIVNQAAMIASRGTPKWLVRRVGGFFGRRAV